MATRSNPYCSFKNDRDRLWALVARDVRDIAIVALLLTAAGHVPPAILARLLTLIS